MEWGKEGMRQDVTTLHHPLGWNHERGAAAKGASVGRGEQEESTS